LDLISAGFSQTLTILTNNGNGGFGSNSVVNIPRYSGSVVAADLNNDGKLDLAVTGQLTNVISVFINNSPFPPA
jgi:hypothetical protein